MDTKFNLYPATKPESKGEYLVLLKDMVALQFDTVHAYFDGEKFDCEKGNCVIIVGWMKLTQLEKQTAG